jgi:hypothetical protein
MTTTYRIKAHEYTEITTCADPQTCKLAAHWDWSSEYDALADARSHDTDEPAWKIYRVQLVEKVTEV